jgi:methyl-CpG-binding domain protein 4
MLNQTSAKQVWPVLPSFFERWPAAVDLACAEPEDVSKHLQSLGLQNRRAKTLIKLSESFLFTEWKKPEDLPGIGKYGSDSYRIFCAGYLVEDVTDKELRKYVEWAKAQQQPKEDKGGGRTS